MWSDVASVFAHASQFAFMFAVILASHAIARRNQDRRLQAEARRLRVALHVGLSGLRDLYGENRTLLDSGDRPLVSGRNQITLLRIQFGRLVSLDDEREIEAVMAANIAMEAAEVAMAVAGTPKGGAAFTMPVDVDTADVRAALAAACAALDEADAQLAAGFAGSRRFDLGGLLSRACRRGDLFAAAAPRPLPAPVSYR